MLIIYQVKFNFSSVLLCLSRHSPMEVELCLFLRQRSHWWMLPAWLLSQHIHLSLWLIRHKETTFDISPMQLLPDTPSSCRSACVCVRAFNKEYVSLNLKKKRIFWVLHVYWGHIPFTNKSNPLFSGSDVGSKWQLLCSLLHPTTKHLNSYGAILVYIGSGGETMVVGPMTAHSGRV